MSAEYCSCVFGCGDSLKLRERITIRHRDVPLTLPKGSIVEVVGKSNYGDQVTYTVHHCSKEFDGDISLVPEYLLESR